MVLMRKIRSALGGAGRFGPHPTNCPFCVPKKCQNIISFIFYFDPNICVQGLVGVDAAGGANDSSATIGFDLRYKTWLLFK
jgi:hypothetical protein